MEMALPETPVNFHRILAALDGDAAQSSSVIATVSELAKAFDSVVMVVDVSDKQALLDETLLELAGQGITVSGIKTPGGGSSAKELFEIALNFQATLIVASNRTSQVAKLFLGEMPNKISHIAPCPVLAVR